MNQEWDNIRSLRAIEVLYKGRFYLAQKLNISPLMINYWHLKKRIPEKYHKILADLSNNKFNAKDFK